VFTDRRIGEVGFKEQVGSKEVELQVRNHSEELEMGVGL